MLCHSLKKLLTSVLKIIYHSFLLNFLKVHILGEKLHTDVDNFVRERAPNHGTTNEEPLCGRHCPCVVRLSVCLPYFVSCIHTGFKLFTKSNEIVSTHLGYRDTEHFRSSIILQKPNCLLCPLWISNGYVVLNVPTCNNILYLYYDLNGDTL